MKPGIAGLDKAQAFRGHPRVAANFMVKIFLEGKSVVAKARDLSMNGLFLQDLPNDGRTVLSLEVHLPGDEPFVADCRVRRRTEDGTAVEFVGLDWDHVFALARYLHPRLP